MSKQQHEGVQYTQLTKMQAKDCEGGEGTDTADGLTS